MGRAVALQALQTAQAKRLKSKSIASELEPRFTSSYFGMGEHSVSYYARKLLTMLQTFRYLF